MFGDRVKHWVTFNEPNLMAKLAYFVGGFPPSHCSEPYGKCDYGNSSTEPYIAAHNMILAHAKTVNIYRKNYKVKQNGTIGITLHMRWFEPLRNITDDHLAVSRALSFEAAWFLDPLFFGDYPHQMRLILGPNLPKFTNAEKQLLKNQIDFIGVNHYDTFYGKDCIYSLCDLDLYTSEALVYELAERNGIPIGKPTPANNYEVPSAMEKLVMYLDQRYKSTPLYITENGYAQIANSSTTAEELINDTERSYYIRDYYLTYLSFALRKGADVRGYFVWSLMDTFEWDSGYTVKYGLYHVDFKSLTRTPKLSVEWYNKFIKGYEQIEMVSEESPKRMIS